VDWQKTGNMCNIGAFVVAVVWGAGQFYIWYRHGEIGMSSLVGFAVLVVILFVSGAMRLMAPANVGESPHRTIAPPVDESLTTSIPIAEPGTTISLSPQELIRLFKTGGTTAQANRLIQPYVGKWMQISGVVDDVTHFGPDTNQVKLRGAMMQFDIVAYFRTKWADEVSLLVKGENTTVRGQFRSIETSFLALENCELLSKGHP
jgi:hypothetical protein